MIVLRIMHFMACAGTIGLAVTWFLSVHSSLSRIADALERIANEVDK